MADLRDASFIPKNSNQPKKRVRTSRRIYVLSYLCYVVFFGTLLVVLGTYVYADQVQKTLVATRAELEEARTTFSEGDIETIRTLEKKLLVANEIVRDTRSPSLIFGELERVIAENVTLKGYTYRSLDNGNFQIQFEAVADDFNSLIFQRSQMMNSELLAAAKVARFDFSRSSSDEEESANENLPSLALGGTPTLVFEFDASASNTLIPYQIRQDETETGSEENEVENVVEELPGSEAEPEVGNEGDQ
jgi:hypothetical protein